jgi:hypothetical protein
MATEADAAPRVGALGARFVAVADADRAAPLFGDPLTGAAFFVGVVRPGAARFPVTDADRFAGALVVLAGAVAAFFGDRAALALDALPAAAGGLRPVVDDLAAVLAAGVRDDVADAFVVARFVGRAAFAAGVLGTVVTFAERDVPDRDTRPPRPTAAMATPSWSELDTRCLRLRFAPHEHRKGGQGYELGHGIATGLAGAVIGSRGRRRRRDGHGPLSAPAEWLRC